MTAAELKACIDAGITEFAIYPAKAGSNVRSTTLAWASRSGKAVLRATIIERNVVWHEGPYNTPRKTGVLVSYYPLKKDGTEAKRPVRLVIERKCVLDTWERVEARLQDSRFADQLRTNVERDAEKLRAIIGASAFRLNFVDYVEGPLGDKNIPSYEPSFSFDHTDAKALARKLNGKSTPKKRSARRAAA
jgi:hypothetical protein